MSDRDLVDALKAGDPDAARRLVERFEGEIFGFCMKMLGHRQDAEDVAQESFVRALRAFSRFDQTRPILPWLLGITANRCRTSLSKRARRPRLVERIDDRPDPRTSQDNLDDLAAELDRALDRIRTDYRLVFVMYHEQNLTYEQIADVVGRPVGTVKTWLHRARAELADQLSRRGITCPAKTP